MERLQVRQTKEGWILVVNIGGIFRQREFHYKSDAEKALGDWDKLSDSEISVNFSVGPLSLGYFEYLSLRDAMNLADSIKSLPCPRCKKEITLRLDKTGTIRTGRCSECARKE